MIEIRVPTLGESVTEATVGKWLKKPGDAVKADEPLVELETDKVTVEVPAPAAGQLSEIVAEQGATVSIGAVLGALSEGGAPAQPKAAPAPAAAPKPAPREAASEPSQFRAPPSPAARKHLADANLGADEVSGSGRRGQVLKEDVVAAVAQAAGRPKLEPVPEPARSEPAPVVRAVAVPQRAPVPEERVPSAVSEAGREERVRMTRLRQTIALRLKEAQNTAAMLTTFND
ncbi:MAG: E3 binding domain-containing protein, partial [Rhizobiales bacterium]|nr:E3 binding domain-containing protein [Hyphomicrobiales bacterium]